MAKDKYLIVKASGGGGLGDLIKSVLVAALYAELSARSLYVDWSGGLYADGSENVFSRLFTLKGIACEQSLPLSNDVYPKRWQNNLDKSLHQVYSEDGWQSWDRERTIRDYSFDLAQLSHPAQTLVMWEFDQIAKLLPHFPQCKNDSQTLFRDAAHRYLQINSDLTEQLQSILAACAEPVLGVHIRKTREFDENKGQSSLGSYFQKIDSIRPNSIFLATDNSAVQESFLRRYPNTIALDKWFAEPGDALHLDLNQQSGALDKFSVLRDALSDILLLSRCDQVLLTPGSSFSEIASYFAAPSMIIHQLEASSLASRLMRNLRLLRRLKG